MNVGPDPRPQGYWDTRAAGNFIGGGFGSGLIVFGALSGAPLESMRLPMVAGAVLVALGLVSVALELGRPFRSFNVIRHARRSWMSREALLAPLVIGSALATAAGVTMLALPAAVLALAFVYCQARMLRAAKGIPAWRAPQLTAYFLATALAEGGGVFWLCQFRHSAGSDPLLAALGAVIALRALAWYRYRSAVSAALPPGARAALSRANDAIAYAGTVFPFVLIVVALSASAMQSVATPVAAIAGLAAAAAGAFVKWTLIVRAGYTQGFTLEHLPVRGAR